MLKASIATSFNCPGPGTNGLAWQDDAIWSVEGGAERYTKSIRRPVRLSLL